MPAGSAVRLLVAVSLLAATASACTGSSAKKSSSPSALTSPSPPAPASDTAVAPQPTGTDREFTVEQRSQIGVGAAGPRARSFGDIAPRIEQRCPFFDAARIDRYDADLGNLVGARRQPRGFEIDER